MWILRRTVLSVGAVVVLTACGADGDEPEPEAAEEPAAEPVDEADGPADDDAFAGEDPFADEDPFDDDWGDDDWGDIREGPGVLPAELQFLLDLPPGARLDHVEAFDGPYGPEYSFDASYHDAGADELAVAADHYRSALPAAGFEVVQEYVDEDVAEFFVTGHELTGSVIIDIEMGSVWINAYLSPEL